MGYLLGNGYRLYNPILMRFCSPDSFSPFMIMNSYAYCEGDPVNSSDPSGHMGVPMSALKQRQIRYASQGLPPFSAEPGPRANMSTLLRNNMWSTPTFYPRLPRRKLPVTGLHGSRHVSAGSAASTSQSSRPNLPISTNSLQAQNPVLPDNTSVVSVGSASSRQNLTYNNERHLIRLTPEQEAELLARAGRNAFTTERFDSRTVSESRRVVAENFIRLNDLSSLRDRRIYVGVQPELHNRVHIWLIRSIDKIRSPGNNVRRS